jgi:LysM repeat protein
VPATPSAKASASNTEQAVYVVESGDNWYSIARRFGTTQEALAAANGRTPSEILQVDEALVIPTASLASTRSSQAAAKATVQATAIPTPQTYTVQRGDNWFTIARRYGITQEALAAFNDRIPSDVLQVNQKLRIPPAGVAVVKPTPVPVEPTAKPTPTAAPEPTPVPTVVRLAAPVLVSPMTGDGFTSDTLPVLTWEPVSGTTSEDYYYVRVGFTMQDGEKGFVPGEVTGTSFTVPRWVHDAARTPDRISSWSVQVLRRGPDGSIIEVSPPSESRTFYWR